MKSSAVKKRTNPWPQLYKELSNRLFNAFKSLRFILVLFVGLFFFSGMGIWFPYLIDDTGNKVLWDSQNLFTFGMAILGGMLIDFVLEEKKTSDVVAVGVFMSIIAIVLCIYGYFQIQSGFSLFTLIGVVVSIFLFIFVNVNNEKYDNDLDRGSVATPTGYDNASADLINDE